MKEKGQITYLFGRPQLEVVQPRVTSEAGDPTPINADYMNRDIRNRSRGEEDGDELAARREAIVSELIQGYRLARAGIYRVIEGGSQANMRAQERIRTMYGEEVN